MTLHIKNNNYLQLLYREVKGILLYQGLPRPILALKNPEHALVRQNFYFPQKVVGHNFIVFCDENAQIFLENFAERVVFLPKNVPRDVK